MKFHENRVSQYFPLILQLYQGTDEQTRGALPYAAEEETLLVMNIQETFKLTLSYENKQNATQN
jgi:hypothetical protein